MVSYKTHQRDQIRYANDWMRCPSCHEKMLFKAFRQHVVKVHHVKPLIQCRYCFGWYKWPRGQKSQQEHVEHRVKCLRECVEKNYVPLLEKRNVVVESPPVEKDEIVMCRECREFRLDPLQMNGRICDQKLKCEGFYDSCFEKPDFWKTEWELFDESKGMYNDQIGIFRRFLLPKDHPDHLIWWHIMVKHDVWPKFIKAMEKIKDEIILLPYWCLCDGSTFNRVLHRHMILVCIPKSSFMKVWKNEVKYDLEMSGERCKYAVLIKDVFHLAHCIQYVSQYKASCDGKKIRDKLDDNKVELSHYRLNQPASPHGVAFRSMLFEGGMEDLIRLANKKKNVVDWVDEAKKLNNHWAVALNVTGFKYLNCVIPLRQDLEPTNEETPMYLIWMKEKSLYLKQNMELLSMSEEEWYTYQVRRGNTFQTIGEEMYVYGHTQQNVMNQLVEQKKQLKRKWVTEWEQRYEEMDEKYKKERMEKDALKQENQNLKQEIHDLKHKGEMQAVTNYNMQNMTINTGSNIAFHINKDRPPEEPEEKK